MIDRSQLVKLETKRCFWKEWTQSFETEKTSWHRCALVQATLCPQPLLAFCATSWWAREGSDTIERDSRQLRREVAKTLKANKLRASYWGSVSGRGPGSKGAAWGLLETAALPTSSPTPGKLPHCDIVSMTVGLASQEASQPAQCSPFQKVGNVCGQETD